MLISLFYTLHKSHHKKCTLLGCVHLDWMEQGGNGMKICEHNLWRKKGCREEYWPNIIEWNFFMIKILGKIGEKILENGAFLPKIEL